MDNKAKEEKIEESKETIKNKKHDQGYKNTFKNKDNMIDFLNSFIKEDWVKNIKKEDLVLIDKEFILSNFKDEEADIVYKVNVDGEEVILYMLLEFQSKVDYRMPIRLFLYICEIYRMYLDEHDDNTKKQKGFRLPPVIPVVLYNGENNWHVPRSFKEVIKSHEMYSDYVIDFNYLLFDIHRMDDEELKKIANVVSTIFYLDKEDNIELIVKRLETIKGVIKRLQIDKKKNLLRWIKNVIVENTSLDNKEKLIELIDETIETQEVDMMISNMGRVINEGLEAKLAEGIMKGKLEGRLEGKVEGFEEHSIITAIEMLQDNMNIELVAKYSKLKISKVKDIKNNLEEYKQVYLDKEKNINLDK
ncbi:Rpn family recombination-promoting nuclease/putative transposase [Peptostreptococcaceae bacterium AGR-M142]